MSANFVEFVNEWLVQFPNDNYKIIPRLQCLNDNSFPSITDQKVELRRQIAETREHIGNLRNSLQRKEFTLIYLDALAKNHLQAVNLHQQHHQLEQDEEDQLHHHEMDLDIHSHSNLHHHHQHSLNHHHLLLHQQQHLDNEHHNSLLFKDLEDEQQLKNEETVVSTVVGQVEDHERAVVVRHDDDDGVNVDDGAGSGRLHADELELDNENVIYVYPSRSDEPDSLRLKEVDSSVVVDSIGDEVDEVDHDASVGQLVDIDLMTANGLPVGRDNQTGVMQLVNYRLVNIYPSNGNTQSVSSQNNSTSHSNQLTPNQGHYINQTQQNIDYLITSRNSTAGVPIPANRTQARVARRQLAPLSGHQMLNNDKISSVPHSAPIPGQHSILISNNSSNAAYSKLYRCRFCSYDSKYPWNVKTHEQIHLGLKPFECSHCKYRCGDASSMKKHMRIHSGERPYACTVCDYRCTMMSNLRSHMRVHTGEKPHACTVCDFRCSQASSLKSHYKTHFR